MALLTGEFLILTNPNGKPRCFWIGYSYNNERWLDADIAEVRIWNRVLSEEEINAKDHAYEVDPNSEGLVAVLETE